MAVNIFDIRHEWATAKADAENHAATCRYGLGTFGHALLHFKSAAGGAERRWKLGHDPISCRFDKPRSVLPELRIDQFAAVRLVEAVGVIFIELHQPGKLHDVSGEDGTPPALGLRLISVVVSCCRPFDRYDFTETHVTNLRGR